MPRNIFWRIFFLNCPRSLCPSYCSQRISCTSISNEIVYTQKPCAPARRVHACNDQSSLDAKIKHRPLLMRILYLSAPAPQPHPPPPPSSPPLLPISRATPRANSARRRHLSSKCQRPAECLFVGAADKLSKSAAFAISHFFFIAHGLSVGCM